jgi:CheY-specific phosphatase CheX
METATIEVQEWLNALVEATRELASSSLKIDRSAPSVRPDARPEESPTAYIAILGEHTSIHLGISCSSSGSRLLVRSLLGLGKSEDMSDDDVLDGMSEMLNILAGKVKARMIARDGSLRLGLPMCIAGQARVSASAERAAMETQVGPVPCVLLVVRNRR